MTTIRLTRLAVTAIFVALLAGSWDVWWHVAVGRDSFAVPPHTLLYSAAMAAILAGIYGWYRTREKVWKKLALVLAIIPLSLPFDELWHHIFGVEDLSSAWAFWSPPHVFVLLTAFTALLFLLPLIRRDETIAQYFFGALAFSGMLGALLALAFPLRPFGPYALIGFWGAGIYIFLIIGVLLVASRWLYGVGGAVLVAVFALVTYGAGIDFVDSVAPGVIINQYTPPPFWLTIFASLSAAAFIDATKQYYAWFIAVIAGLIYGGLLYGFSSQFLEPQFQYGGSETLIAVFASLLGGLLAGFVCSCTVMRNL